MSPNQPFCEPQRPNSNRTGPPLWRIARKIDRCRHEPVEARYRIAPEYRNSNRTEQAPAFQGWEIPDGTPVLCGGLGPDRTGLLILPPGSWIRDPGSWIQDPGSWIEAPGSWTPGSWVQDPRPWILDPRSGIQPESTIPDRTGPVLEIHVFCVDRTGLVLGGFCFKAHNLNLKTKTTNQTFQPI